MLRTARLDLPHRLVSTAYADARYPAHKSFAAVQSELSRRVQGRVLSLLRPSNLSAYLSTILAKRRAGQPIAFTDFFSLMLGETLIPDVRLRPPLDDNSLTYIRAYS